MLGFPHPYARIGAAGGENRNGAEQQRRPHGHGGHRPKGQPHDAHGLGPRGWGRDLERVELLAEARRQRLLEDAL